MSDLFFPYSVLVLLSILLFIAMRSKMSSRLIYFISSFVCMTAVYIGIAQLDADLERFYIFDPDKLHSLALQSIELNGNNTAGIVATIVHGLRQDPKIDNHVNVDQEWIFNNAGGAMGAMYIIHASMSIILRLTILADITRYNGVLDHFRDCHWHRRPHGTTHCR
jgi:hypothetical protein